MEQNAPASLRKSDKPKKPAEVPKVMTEVAQKIAASQNVLIALSNNPSVDELATAIGLSLFLSRLGKRATAIYSGSTPNVLRFLKPNEIFESSADTLQDFVIALNKEKADHLRYKLDGDYVKIFITPYKTRIGQEDLAYSYGDFNVDLVLALNVASGTALDSALREHGRIMHDAIIINITTGEPGQLGEIEWSDKTASSIAEMITRLLFTVTSETLEPEEATAFLTGIVAATDRFSNSKTTPETMDMASELMRAGANQQLVSRNITPETSNAPTNALNRASVATTLGSLKSEAPAANAGPTDKSASAAPVVGLSSSDPANLHIAHADPDAPTGESVSIATDATKLELRPEAKPAAKPFAANSTATAGAAAVDLNPPVATPAESKPTPVGSEPTSTEPKPTSAAPKSTFVESKSVPAESKSASTGPEPALTAPKSAVAELKSATAESKPTSTESETGAKSASGPAPDSKDVTPASEPKSEPSPDSKPVSESEPKSESKAESESKPGAQPTSAPTEPKPESKPAAAPSASKSDAPSESDSPFGPISALDPDAVMKTLSADSKTTSSSVASPAASAESGSKTATTSDAESATSDSKPTSESKSSAESPSVSEESKPASESAPKDAMDPALLDDLKAAEASLSGVGSDTLGGAAAEKTDSTGPAPAMTISTASPSGSNSGLLSSEPEKTSSSDDAATDKTSAPGDTGFLKSNPEKTIQPPASAEEIANTTAQYGKMLESSLASVGVSAAAPVAPASSAVSAAAPTTASAPLASSPITTPVVGPISASPVPNPAQAAAPPVAASPEINGVPEINYAAPVNSILPPPPAPPIDANAAMNMPPVVGPISASPVPNPAQTTIAPQSSAATPTTPPSSASTPAPATPGAPTTTIPAPTTLPPLAAVPAPSATSPASAPAPVAPQPTAPDAFKIPGA